jgi:uncharacterized protein YjbJ (UPF0337 family)
MSDNHSLEDKMKGKGNQLKGEVKKGYGKMVDDDSKVAEGRGDKLKGKAQEKVGQAKDFFSK